MKYLTCSWSHVFGTLTPEELFKGTEVEHLLPELILNQENGEVQIPWEDGEKWKFEGQLLSSQSKFIQRWLDHRQVVDDYSNQVRLRPGSELGVVYLVNEPLYKLALKLGRRDRIQVS